MTQANPFARFQNPQAAPQQGAPIYAQPAPAPQAQQPWQPQAAPQPAQQQYAQPAPQAPPQPQQGGFGAPPPYAQQPAQGFGPGYGAQQPPPAQGAPQAWTPGAPPQLGTVGEQGSRLPIIGSGGNGRYFLRCVGNGGTPGGTLCKVNFQVAEGPNGMAEVPNDWIQKINGTPNDPPATRHKWERSMGEILQVVRVVLGYPDEASFKAARADWSQIVWDVACGKPVPELVGRNVVCDAQDSGKRDPKGNPFYAYVWYPCQ